MEDDGQKDLEELIQARDAIVEKRVQAEMAEKRKRQPDEWDAALDGGKVSTDSTSVICVVNHSLSGSLGLPFAVQRRKVKSKKVPVGVFEGGVNPFQKKLEEMAQGGRQPAKSRKQRGKRPWKAR